MTNTKGLDKIEDQRNATEKVVALTKTAFQKTRLLKNLVQTIDDNASDE